MITQTLERPQLPQAVMDWSSWPGASERWWWWQWSV